MRVAYNNILETAIDFAATNVDNDSYATNLYHPYLENAMYCTEIQSVLTGRWNTAQEITCYAVGFHNCETVLVELLDEIGTVLFSETKTLEFNDAIYYLTSLVTGVYAFRLTFDSYEAVRIGYVYLGRCVTLPAISIGSGYGYAFNSTATQSLGGQTYGVFGRMLRTYKATIPRYNLTVRNALKTYFETVQNIKPHMIDLFPDDHDAEPAFYGTLALDVVEETKRNESGFMYSIPLTWKEAR
jgi:hypothetical protein